MQRSAPVTIAVGLVLSLLAPLASGGRAAAKAWPTPAAGASASGGPEIVFTFDDGPNPKTTPLVLDALARHHIHAVFFLVGEMAENKSHRVTAILQRILRDGHVIASHTMKHHDLCRVSEAAAAADIDDGKAAVEQAAGVPTAWFRVPFGVRCTRLEHMLDERHLTHFHWDLDPQEWKHNDSARAVRYVTGELDRASGREVLLMHDIKQATTRALPQILDWIDAENARREKSHKKPIRIVDAPALAVERLPPGMTAWLGDATAGAARSPASSPACCLSYCHASRFDQIHFKLYRQPTTGRTASIMSTCSASGPRTRSCALRRDGLELTTHRRASRSAPRSGDRRVAWTSELASVLP